MRFTALLVAIVLWLKLKRSLPFCLCGIVGVVLPLALYDNGAVPGTPALYQGSTNAIGVLVERI
jgi:hypothetical protein